MPIEEKGSAEEIDRLKRERDEADRLYNEALTRLDAAIQTPREFPHPPPPYDEFQITPLNQRWELLSLKPDEGRGWLRRLRAHAWAMVAPLFERQQAFNSAVVDHINRNIATQRETTRAIEATLTVLREDQKRFIEYQTLLILYAQQITPYVDTKDRHVAGLMHGLAAGLSGLGDEIQKRWESMVARERRYDAQVNDVRTTLGVMQRAVQTLKRELERPGATGATGLPRRSGDLSAEARSAKVRRPRRRVRRRSRWTLTSTSASRISFGDRSTTLPSASRHTCRSSKARATCWTWDAGAESFWSCFGRKVFPRVGST